MRQIRNMEQWGKVAHLGLGSNQNSPHEQCLEAIGRLLRTDGIRVVQCSPFYRTEPVGTPGGDWFINAVVEIRTALSPLGLLAVLQDLERAMGRVRTVEKGPRIIDLDILLFNQDIIFDEDRLIVPHPEIHKRRFVLVPMNDIASYVIHPAFGVSMKGLLDRCSDRSVVERFADPAAL
ncbi:MAG TPA: 2-amino-4-hydroxy-6-hydroxymethyldihydropteridine diphosphokinase [Syntrophales bacterium]|nr:2-amino-4-hydroxy-6-hydroxymethyldihydropteridine diphosphokinase [Syntrophales bacterium]